MRVDQLIEALQEIPDQYLEVLVSGRQIHDVYVRKSTGPSNGIHVNIEPKLRY